MNVRPVEILRGTLRFTSVEGDTLIGKAGDILDAGGWNPRALMSLENRRQVRSANPGASLTDLSEIRSRFENGGTPKRGPGRPRKNQSQPAA